MRAAFLLVALGGCGVIGGSNSMSGDDTTTPVDCSTVMGVDTFTVGLEKLGASGNYDFKLMSAMPSPPARGDNTWVLQVNAMTSGAVGAPVTGASLTVTPYMPAHQRRPVPLGNRDMADVFRATVRKPSVGCSRRRTPFR